MDVRMQLPVKSGLLLTLSACVRVIAVSCVCVCVCVRVLQLFQTSTNLVRVRVLCPDALDVGVHYLEYCMHGCLPPLWNQAFIKKSVLI